MMKITKIYLLIALLGCVSCSDNEKESKVPQKEAVPKDDIANFVDADFRLQNVNYTAKIPKGAYIDDEGMVTHVYLSPTDEERMVVAPWNGENTQVAGDIEKNKGFVHYGDGFMCVFGPKLESSGERIDSMNIQFKLIAKNIRRME